jgi:hypothetical protein
VANGPPARLDACEASGLANLDNLSGLLANLGKLQKPLCHGPLANLDSLDTLYQQKIGGSGQTRFRDIESRARNKFVKSTRQAVQAVQFMFKLLIQKENVLDSLRCPGQPPAYLYTAAALTGSSSSTFVMPAWFFLRPCPDVFFRFDSKHLGNLV